MPSTVTEQARPTSDDQGPFPAYGAVEAVLSLAMFYVFVDYLTPTFVDGFATVLDVAPSAIATWIAVFIWFIVAVTLVDHGRRQLAALGVGSHPGNRPWPAWAARFEPSSTTYLALAMLGGGVAALTFDTALVAAESLSAMFFPLDPSAFAVVDLVVVIVFGVSWSVATQSVDRAVVQAVRGSWEW